MKIGSFGFVAALCYVFRHDPVELSLVSLCPQARRAHSFHNRHTLIPAPDTMRTATLKAIILILAAGALVRPQCVYADEPAKWIRENAIRMRSLNPLDQDFTDLAPLKKLIGNSRVVMLGEQTHGDGATFLGKTRLIEFLHAEMGFDVLCFESGLYGCDRAWAAMRAGTDAATAMKLGVFSIWMSSKQLVPLTEFLDKVAKTDRPMEICGYDCQLTGSASYLQLVKDIKKLAESSSPPALDQTRLAALEAYVTSLLAAKVLEDNTRLDGEVAIAALVQALHEPRFSPMLTPRDRDFWIHFLQSVRGLAEHRGRSKQLGLTLAERFNGRDQQGGETLAWLARERYPDRKIIVWAASMHCVRRAERIDTMTAGLNYDGLRTAGHVATEVLGDSVFVISFTTGPGEAGTVMAKKWAVPPAPAGSLEAICAELELGACIIPLRGSLDDSFGGSVFVARPLGNTPMRSRWRDNVDAFVFTPTTFPSAHVLPSRAYPFAYILAAERDKKFTAAFDLANEALAENADNYSALYHYGRIAATSGQELERGLARLEKCLTLTPPEVTMSHASVWHHIGVLQEKLEDTVRARSAYDAALQLNPNHKEAAVARARLQ